MFSGDLEIPLDIMELIVNESAATDDPKLSTLKSLSLTCKLLLESCRTHIFRTVDLRYAPGRDGKDALPRYTRFLDALESSPLIASHVREFYVDDGEDAQRRVIQQPSLPRVLLSLYYISTLSLCFTNSQSIAVTSVTWTSLSSSLQNAVSSVIHFSSLKDIAIKRLYGMPHSFIKSLLRIQKVHLNTFCAFSNDTNNQWPLDKSLKPSGGLQSLTLINMELEDAKPLLDCMASTCELQELHSRVHSYVGLRERNVELMHYILLTQKNSITKLCFSIEESTGLRIGDIPHLQSLIIYVDDIGGYKDYEPLTIAHSILSSVREDNEVQEIIFRIDVFYVCHRMDSIAKWQGWRELQTLFTGSSFKSLTTVRFDFLSHDHQSVEAEELREEVAFLGEYLPKLQESGILQVIHDDYDK